MITFDKSSVEKTKVKSAEEMKKLVSDDKITWINLVGLHNINMIKEIGQIFDIHNIDLEDIVHVSQRSKIEIKDSYLFSIFKMIYLKDNNITQEHLSIIFKDNIILSFQETSDDVFDNIRERLDNDIGIIRRMDIDYLYYSLLDALIDQYFPIINKTGNSLSDIEMKVMKDINIKTEEIYKLRQQMIFLINALNPIKEGIQRFSENDSLYIKSDIKRYYHDLIDHLNEIKESLRAYSEIVNNLHEMQMINVSDDINKTMMTLTIFSAIFIPLSFLAGVFGMNFAYIPGLKSNNAFLYFVISSIIIVFIMLGYFKKKKWF